MVAASSAFPTSITSHDLNCAMLLTENARANLAEAFRLLRGDPVLAVRVELAGKAVVALRESTAARFQPAEMAMH